MPSRKQTTTWIWNGNSPVVWWMWGPNPYRYCNTGTSSGRDKASFGSTPSVQTYDFIESVQRCWASQGLNWEKQTLPFILALESGEAMPGQQATGLFDNSIQIQVIRPSWPHWIIAGDHHGSPATDNYNMHAKRDSSDTLLHYFWKKLHWGAGVTHLIQIECLSANWSIISNRSRNFRLWLQASCYFVHPKAFFATRCHRIRALIISKLILTFLVAFSAALLTLTNKKHST